MFLLTVEAKNTHICVNLLFSAAKFRIIVRRQQLTIQNGSFNECADDPVERNFRRQNNRDE